MKRAKSHLLQCRWEGKSLPVGLVDSDIWNLGAPKFIQESMKHMNSYMKKSYEFYSLRWCWDQ